jgi:hypothetical protein
MFKQGLPALPSLDPLPRLVQGEPACPGSEGKGRIIGVKLLPKGQSGLLNNILRVRDIRDQGGHVTKDLALASQEQRKKPLLHGA